MTDCVFTVFDGPDIGMRFILEGKPLTLGREPGRDVLLRDDRASRLHARLELKDGQVLLSDNNSSNGTFVNGVLSRAATLKPGDVIVIGGNSIVFGTEPPPLRTAAQAAPRVPVTATGATTLFLPETHPPTLDRREARLLEIVEALGDAAQESAGKRGMVVSIEAELKPDTVLIDPGLVYRGMAAALDAVLGAMPIVSREPGTRAEGALIIRFGPDPLRAGFAVEIFCIGVKVPARAIVVKDQNGALADAAKMAQAHGGTLEVLPGEAPETLLRLRLPLPPPSSTSATVIR